MYINVSSVLHSPDHALNSVVNEDVMFSNPQKEEPHLAQLLEPSFSPRKDKQNI